MGTRPQDQGAHHGRATRPQDQGSHLFIPLGHAGKAVLQAALQSQNTEAARKDAEKVKFDQRSLMVHTNKGRRLVEGELLKAYPVGWWSCNCAFAADADEDLQETPEQIRLNGRRYGRTGNMWLVQSGSEPVKVQWCYVTRDALNGPAVLTVEGHANYDGELLTVSFCANDEKGLDQWIAKVYCAARLLSENRVVRYSEEHARFEDLVVQTQGGTTTYLVGRPEDRDSPDRTRTVPTVPTGPVGKVLL